LLTAALPKIDFSVLAWLALVPMLYAVLQSSDWRQALRLGFVTGLAHFLTLVYWLVDTMQTYGHLPVYLSVPLLFLLASYLALYIGGFGLLTRIFLKRPLLAMASVPACWVILEYLRAILFTGFPWAMLGYSQHGTLPLIQLADICGVYGVSFVIVQINVTLLLIGLFFLRPAFYRGCLSIRVLTAAVLIAAVTVGAVMAYGNARMRTIEQALTAARHQKIAIIQGNIDQLIKWDPAFQIATTEKYLRLSAQACQASPDLVVWPETATPFYFGHNREMTAKVNQRIAQCGNAFLIGSPSFVRKGEDVSFYNSAFLLDGQARSLGTYSKAHLVPFGEYVPLKKWLPFIGKMVEHVGDFEAGEPGATIAWPPADLGVLICYEVIFPELARAAVQNDAAVLINLTNDAWYGTSSAPYQLFAMAVFRAIETRRGLVRAANTGISGYIDPIGHSSNQTELFSDAVLTRPVPIVKEIDTLYVRYGNLFAWICLLLCVVGLAFKRS
jgi:apolipoprotein N-acyltransferase